MLLLLFTDEDEVRMPDRSPEQAHSLPEKSVENNHPCELSRRDFARDLAVAATAMAIFPAEALAQKQEVPAAPKPPANLSDMSAQAKAEVEGNYQAVLRKYGSRLSSEQKLEVRRLLLQQQKSIEMVRNYKIENGDGPATVLHLVSGEAK